MWRRVVIDLTSLLDVCLILLFLVVTNISYRADALNKTAADKQTQINSLEQSMSELKAQNDGLEQKLGGMSLINERCRLISLYVDPADASGARTVHLESGETKKAYTLTWTNQQLIAGALLTGMKSIFASGGADAVYFVVFRYDSGKIYQADYRLLVSALNRAKSMNSAVYTAQTDIAEAGDA